ncbi:MAG: hypothetical protein ACJAYG_002832 [Oceanicoccus sp.]|jgi:hypothetical protein
MYIQFLKDPLFHFLILGCCLFAVFEVLNPASTEPSNETILVNQDTLLTYIQSRTKRFDEQRFGQQFDAMPAAQRERLLDDYVREEVLFREAKRLRLDQNDQVFRQRLIQKMRYITQSFIRAGQDATDAELLKFYEQNTERYKEPSKVTFTHVFFSSEQRSLNEARARAEKQLLLLNRQRVPFHKTLGLGERFLYHRNYVQKEADLVASHFSDDLQKRVFSQPPSDSRWLGPYQSPYGYHLVLLTQNIPETTPAFDDVKERVAQDWRQQDLQVQLDAAITRLTESYTIERAGDLSQSTKAGS